MHFSSLLPSPYKLISKNLISSSSLPADELVKTMDISMVEEGSHPTVLSKVPSTLTSFTASFHGLLCAEEMDGE